MRSLVFKLTLAFLILGVTGAALVAVILHQRTRTAFDQFVLSREQQALVDILARYYIAYGSWDGVAETLQPLIDASQQFNQDTQPNLRQWDRFSLVAPDRTIVFSSQPDQVGKRVSNREISKAILLTFQGKTAGWLIITRIPVQLLPNSPEAIFLNAINRATLLSGLVAAGLALILGGVLAFTLTRSLSELTEATNAIARGQLGRQVKVRSKDELGDLAVSFNKMSLDLEKATESRRQMTADIAHDLRSPLSVISGYAEALSDGKLPGTPEVYGILHQEALHLSRLVEDLRTLSLVDAGELDLLIQPIDPHLLLERAAARHAVSAQQKEVAIRVEPVEKPLPVVSVDPERMAQVFDNLISNALRHTPQGGQIVLSANGVNGRVTLQVADNGSGIAAEDLPHIFDRFYRGDKSRRQSGESGLGLAIARSIVEAHGGKINVESQSGQGAAFKIQLDSGK